MPSDGLMQNPKHMRKPCGSCGADSGQPCITVDGYIAERVHWGRTSPPRCKIVGQGKEIDFWLHEFEVVTHLVERDPNYTESEDRPVLFTGTNICADCGERYNQPALLRRCQDRHPGRVRP